MHPKYDQVAPWLTTISIVAAGLLSGVHVHAPGESCHSYSHAGKIACHGHGHSHAGEAASHALDPKTSGENELPFLPEHDSDACVICQFTGDRGNLTILPLATGSLEISQSVVIRPNQWILLEDAFVYRGRGPPVIFSI